MKNSTPVNANMAQLQARAKELRLAGLLAHWDTMVCDPARMGWVAELLDWEETERDQRRLERRLRASHIGKFKPLWQTMNGIGPSVVTARRSRN